MSNINYHPNEITLKELYERIIVLETKLDGVRNQQILDKQHANKLAVLIIFSVLVDVVIHGFLFYVTSH